MIVPEYVGSCPLEGRHQAEWGELWDIYWGGIGKKQEQAGQASGQDAGLAAVKGEGDGEMIG